MNEHLRQKKTVRLFRNGRSQAIRIPKEFEFEGEDVEIEKLETGELVVRKKLKTAASLLEVLAAMPPLGPEDEFPEIDDSDLLPLDEPDLGP